MEVSCSLRNKIKITVEESVFKLKWSSVFFRLVYNFRQKEVAFDEINSAETESHQCA